MPKVPGGPPESLLGCPHLPPALLGPLRAPKILLGVPRSSFIPSGPPRFLPVSPSLLAVSRRSPQSPPCHLRGGTVPLPSSGGPPNAWVSSPPRQALCSPPRGNKAASLLPGVTPRAPPGSPSPSLPRRGKTGPGRGRRAQERPALAPPPTRPGAAPLRDLDPAGAPATGRPRHRPRTPRPTAGAAAAGPARSPRTRPARVWRPRRPGQGRARDSPAGALPPGLGHPPPLPGLGPPRPGTPPRPFDARHLPPLPARSADGAPEEVRQPLAVLSCCSGGL